MPAVAPAWGDALRVLGQPSRCGGIVTKDPAVSRELFAEYVADAYEHLHDLVYLRKHPLAEALFPTLAAAADRRRARELHNLLYDLIDELDPGPKAATFSPQWRRHRYMVLRYLKGLSHEEIADQFGVGLRQYYRLRRSIVDEVTGVLWDRYVAGHCATHPAPEPIEDEPAANQLALLRLEGARLAQTDRYAHIPEVTDGVIPLLQAILRQHEIGVRLSFPDGLPAVAIAQDMLRHMLLQVLGLLTAWTGRAAIRLAARVEGPVISLTAQVEPPGAASVHGHERSDERLAELEEMANLSGCHILPIAVGDAVSGFELRLPVAQRTVLIVDDNEDTIHLFQRYLGLRGYSVVGATTASDALDKARQYRPYAITLDLMMPGHDGWELLQTVANDPDTRRIPIIVCTVLKQKELALSLGASEYLEKPVTEQRLLSALDTLAKT
jgi:CheY-like chemotaxis protein